MLRLVSNTCVAGLIATSTAVSGQAGQADIIFVGAKVVTADSSQPLAEAIALAGDRIRAVGSIEEIRRRAGVQTRSINLQGATILPGLIDAHVHLLIAPQITDEPSLRSYERTALPKVMSGFISHGITTVRSVGDPLPYIVELRDRMNPSVVGPRLVVTGPQATSPGFHAATTVCPNNPFCQTFERLLRILQRFGDAKVKLVVGTDWHERPHNADDSRLMAGARTLHEMEILRRAGLTTTDIVTAATRNGAEALGIADKVGTIAEGKLADLVILNGDFLQDFSALHRPTAVFKEGRLVHGSLPER